MTDYTDREESRQSGRPIDIYTALVRGRTYRMTQAEEDVVFDSRTYVATTISRSNQQLSQVGKPREITVTMPGNHEVVTRWMLDGIPPRDARMTITRIHRDASTPEQIFDGPISQIQRTSNGLANLRIPSATDQALDVQMPTYCAQRTCQHALYGPACRVWRGYPVYATAQNMTACKVASISADGLTITIDNIDGPSATPRDDGWANQGEIRRVADAESRDVISQVGVTIVVDIPFPGLTVGEDLELYAGCDKLIETCDVKFNNARRFGNHPYLPANNPFAPTGAGLKR